MPNDAFILYGVILSGSNIKVLPGVMKEPALRKLPTLPLYTAEVSWLGGAPKLKPILPSVCVW